MELFVGQNIVKLSEVDSTNNYLKTLLSKYEPLTEGTVIMAEHQFAGKGQQGSQWQSQAGKNLTFSICLYPDFLLPLQQFELNKAISLGVTDALTLISASNYKLKWPNDIYLNNKKLGGILIENSLNSNRIKYSIVGIGLNVNQTDFGDLNTATSLKLHLQEELEKDLLLTKLCTSIEYRYLQLKNGESERLHKDYIQRLYRFDELTEFVSEGQHFEGKIIGVSDMGELMVLAERNARKYSLKTISFANMI